MEPIVCQPHLQWRTPGPDPRALGCSTSTYSLSPRLPPSSSLALTRHQLGTDSPASMAPSPSNHGLPHDSSPSASSSTAAADAQSPTQNAPQEQSSKELELQRKRARDRKSQQAMRDRNKWTIHTLTEQVGILSTALDQRARDLAALEAQIGFLKAENTQLRTQNAVLQRHMADRNDDDGDASASRTGHSPGSSGGLPSPPWKLVPKNTPPSCLTDQIVQGFVDTIRAAGALTPSWPRENTKVFPLKPNLCSLLDETHRSDDGISNVVADIIRTYPEIISGLPRQVGVFYLITTFLKVSSYQEARTRLRRSVVGPPRQAELGSHA